MTQQLINIGANANDGTGDSLRTAFGKINNNFSTLYSTSLTTGPQGSVQYRATINIAALAYNDTQYVAIATPNRILVSTDATNWTTIVSPSTKTPRAITVVDTTFVITGDNGLVMTSADGSAWTVIASGTTASLTGIAYDKNNSVLVAVGNTGTTLRSTDSGVTWSTVTSIVTDNLNAVAWVETLDLFVAVGDNGVILTSTVGGTSWSQALSNTTVNLNGVSAKLNDVIVVGDAGKIITSPNTILWSIQTSGTTNNLNDVTVAMLGTAVTAIAVGNAGTILTSLYDTTFGFNAWVSTAYPSTTTIDLATVDVVNSQVYAGGQAGTLVSIVGSTWSNSSITLGIDGNSGFTYDPYAHVLSLNADIIPQTSNTWSLGSDTNRYDSAYFNTTGVTIGDVTLTETGSNTLSLLDQSGNLANIEADTGTFSNVVTENLTANLANIDTANIANLESANATLGNLTVANLTLTTLTITDINIPGNVDANNATFTGDVTANAFIGDGSQLTNLQKKAAGPTKRVQFADANIDLASAPNFEYDTANFELLVPNITVQASVSAYEVTAANIEALFFYGDGSNLTNMPVTGLVAGTDISITSVNGIWTISSLASGGGGGGGSIPTLSSGPVKSIQYAGPGGTFSGSSALQFDHGINQLTLTGNVSAFNFSGNVIGGNGAFDLVTASQVIATTFNGDLDGNVNGGNVTADTGTFSGNITAGNITTGSISLDTQTSNEANIGNIHISRSNIHEFGAGNDNFVIDTERSNLVIQGANVATLNVDAPFVLIRGGNVAGSATGGNVTVESGSGGSAGKAGTLTLKGGQGGFGNDGGNIDILGGNGGYGGDGGSINIIAGVTEADTVTIHGANLYLQAGNTINEDAGTLVLQGGNAQGAVLNGGNITITPGTGSQADGYVYIANIQWPNDLGLNNQVLTSDGNGISRWVTLNSGSPGAISVSNIVHGFSNVEINTHSGPVTVGIGGTANVATFTSSGLETLSVKTDTIILGNATQTACTTNWYKKSTTTAVADQILIQMPAGLQISTDFKIIAHNVGASTRQSSMITTVTSGSLTNYSEYATTFINTVIADFTVDQLGGNIRLLVTPRVATLIQYTIIVSSY